MIEIINEERKGREVVRLGDKLYYDKNDAQIASFIAKALVKEDAEVYIKYINDDKNKLNSKLISVMLILGRMMKDPLERICGSAEEVPSKYKGKKLTVVAEMPYLHSTDISAIKEINGEYKMVTPSTVNTPPGEVVTKKATIIKLRLAITD